ncbi:MAG: hypothetical protein NT139_01615, partial [Candidatus Woesearchaeota archaeon]|nr:hypothetical protein [Candidatus Woesearchaeota archaeon]
LSVIKRSESSPRGEDADNKDRNKKQPVTEETPIQSNRVTGSTVNTPKANKLIETVLEKAGFNSDMFKKPNISWGIIGSLIIIAILVGVWIKIRINRRKHFGF